MFRIPELTYPLTVDTIGKTLAKGDEISFFCNNKGCANRHNKRLNLVAMAGKFGLDHGCLRDDLLKVLVCKPCERESRNPKNLGFTMRPAQDYSRWPQTNAYEKASRGE